MVGPGNERISIAELHGRIATNAQALRGLAGERWAPLADNALDFSIAFLALLNAGKTVVMPPSNQPDAVNDPALRIDAVLATNDVDGIKLPLTHLLQVGDGTKLQTIDGDAVIEMFTSGSTGAPKCVRKRFRQLDEEARVLASTFDGMLGNATVFATVPHFHIYGLLFRVLWPLRSGRPFSAEQTLTPRAYSAEGAVLVSSPAFLKRLNNPMELRPNRLSAIFSSGGAIAPEVARQIAEAAGCPLIEVYGSTETGGIAWRRWPDGDGNWRYFTGVERRLEEDDENQCRLHVKSAATDGKWIDSGDVVESVGEGFTLLGRADGILKVEDKRVSIPALESWLERHANVRQARILMLEGKRTELGAVVQLQPGMAQADSRKARRRLAAELKKHLVQRFDRIATPRRWRFVMDMPANEMGKVTRQSLLELFRRERGAS